MKHTETTSYEYEFYWVSYKGKITIAQLKLPQKYSYKNYNVVGEVLSVCEDNPDFQVLERIEDYSG